jgi:hypothetical protein
MGVINRWPGATGYAKGQVQPPLTADQKRELAEGLERVRKERLSEMAQRPRTGSNNLAGQGTAPKGVV